MDRQERSQAAHLWAKPSTGFHGKCHEPQARLNGLSARASHCLRLAVFGGTESACRAIVCPPTTGPGAALVAISKGRLCAFPHCVCRKVRPAIWCKGLRHLTLHAFYPHFPAMINATPTQLRKAADIQEKIQSLQEELGQLLGGEITTPAEMTEAPKKYKFSAAARAKMRRAQKARWAKIKGTSPAARPGRKAKRKMSAKGLANIRAGVAKRMAAQGKVVQKPKKKFSAAGRAALSAAAKARWAKAKRAGKTSL